MSSSTIPSSLDRTDPEAHALVQVFVTSLNRPQALAALLHTDAVWWLPPSLGTPAQVGRDAITRFRERLHADVLVGDSVKVELHDVIASGRKIALRTRITATAKAGASYDNDHTYFLEVRDGLIASVQELLDPAHAIAQLQPKPGANEAHAIERLSPTHTRVRTSIEIDAPHDVVWAVLTDFKSLPRWSSGLQGLEGDFREGGKVEVTFRMYGLDQVYRHELRFFEPGAQFGWSDEATGVFTDRHVYRVEPLLNGRTRFVQSDEPQGNVVPLLGGMIARQIVSQYQTFNRELKARAEQVHRGA